MKKDNTIRKAIILVVLIGVIGGAIYYYFFVRENNEGGIIPSFINGSKNVNDVKNGIYVYKEKTYKTMSFYSGCVVSSIDDYIVVINDKYKKYHGSCMILKYTGEGNTADLEFKKEKNFNYYINIEDKKYIKDTNSLELDLEKSVSNSLSKLSLSQLEFILKYAETPGNYYSFHSNITGGNDTYSINLKYDNASNSFSYVLSSESVLYDKVFSKPEDFPYLRFTNGRLNLIEHSFINNKYSSNLLVFANNTKNYSFSDSLPLKVNGETIDSSYNNLIRYDVNEGTFFVVFSRDNTFCNSESDITYYEFKLNYEYKKGKYGIPEFHKKGKKDEGCKYIKKYYGLEG